MPRRSAMYVACSLALAATGLWVGSASAAAATRVVSTNWSGYAVRSKSGTKFQRVSGTWVAKKPDCSARSPSYSAGWVGIGGFADSARAVEQTGTDADCTASGKTRFRAWYELLPAPAKSIGITVHAGDRMSASVKVQGTQVTIKMRNRTTGATFSKTVSMSSPDVTSAEWIVEAPSSCDDKDNCSFLPLSDFGTVPFTSASATPRNGKAKSISNGSFSAFRVNMRTAASDGATASALSSGGSAFSVTYRQHVARSGARAKTLPRFGP